MLDSSAPTLVAPEAPPASAPTVGPKDSFREIVESVAVAFVLAFLFRSFVAEPFVIPTGSMAPTLMGRHKDVVCPQCKFAYTANAAEEINRDTGARLTGIDVLACTCPLCRYTVTMDELNKEHGHAGSYSGDRILASKFPGTSMDPNRWDVIVFRFPSNPKDNYIKRLVGLPHEQLQIYGGDILTRPLEATTEPFTIARKPPQKVQAMMQIVYDNDFPSPKLREAGWPERWQADASATGHAATPAGNWQPVNDEGKAFHISAGQSSAGQSADGASTRDDSNLNWLRYRHFVPTQNEWERISAGHGLDRQPRPQLITDFYSYNTAHTVEADGPYSSMLGLHWVGDLVLECTITPQKTSGAAVLELVEGGERFHCRLDLSTGDAKLSIEGHPEYSATAKTSVGDGKSHAVRFANVDDQLDLWIDDELVTFDKPTAYEGVNTRRPQVADLSPAGIAADGAQIDVSGLRILRDVYYIATRGGLSDYPQNLGSMSPSELRDFFSDPMQWAALASPAPREFSMQDDEFMFLGDNSPESFDGRLWHHGHTVRRELLIGKALLVYWPHAWETSKHIQFSKNEMRFPFYPDFSRMRAIH